jgi:hypothetical protein
MDLNLKNKILFFADYGHYIDVAIELSKYFKEVLYYIEYRDGFPRASKKIIGKGVDNITRVYNIDDYENEADIFFFSDLFFGSRVDRLRAEGKLVYGAGKGDQLEINRSGFKLLMKELNMPVNEYSVVKGISKLREYLQEHDNVYVKLNSDIRGELESSHSENYKLFEPVLNSLQHTLGLDAEDVEFLVEQPIMPAIEYGYDGFTIDGRYPNKTLFGIEVKDSGYCGVISDYDKLPQSVKEYNEKLSSTLQTYGYRGNIGNEIRHQPKGDAYLIDIYCRLPQPPTSLQIRMIENYGEIVWLIAYGIVPEIKFKYKYGAQIIIKSDWARNEPQAIYFPEKYKDFISIKNLVIQDGIYYYVPQIGCEMEEIGACVGMGNTLSEAISQAKKIAKEIKGYCIKVNGDALDEAEAEIKKLSTIGIKLF